MFSSVLEIYLQEMHGINILVKPTSIDEEYAF